MGDAGEMSVGLLKRPHAPAVGEIGADICRYGRLRSRPRACGVHDHSSAVVATNAVLKAPTVNALAQVAFADDLAHLFTLPTLVTGHASHAEVRGDAGSWLSSHAKA
jgi:hypothetical protein